MKVYINKYKHHWLSPYTILEKVFFWREIDYSEPIIEKWSDRLEPICKGIQTVLDFIDPKIDYVKIDKWDTWSMDYTLSHIIVPMLKQLKETKHGSPNVDDEDVPEHLRSTAAPAKENDWDIDDNHFKRWDWVLDEMIWAFEQNLDTNSEEKFFDHSEVDTKMHSIFGQIEKIKIDKEGLDAHQDRKSNGFRLFGKYYQALWD
jgi:hypothetical protein